MSTAEMTYQEIGAARRAELEALIAIDGTLRPADVVKFARNPNTALHTVFEWDDSVAGEQFRRWQAQSYIRAVVKVIPVDGSDEPMKVRGYVSLSRDRSEGAYREISAVMEDPTMRDEMLREAVAEYKAFRTKYQHLNSLSQFFAAADAAIPKAA